MTRPLRLEYAGALYHVTSRGDRKASIYLDDSDRLAWLATLELVCRRFNMVVHAYCQMANHFHLMLETVEGNLADGMRQLNGLYSQFFNRRHGLVGHVFQGRYKAILVQKDSYLLELTRYVVLNPVRAGMVVLPDDWPWSSYRLMLDKDAAPSWLDVDWTLAQFGEQRDIAIAAYRRFVAEGIGLDNPLKDTSHQTMLGDDAFVGSHQRGIVPEQVRAVSIAQRRVLALPLDVYASQYPDRTEAIARAYHSTAYTMEQIAVHFGISDTTVSRAVRSFKKT